MTSANHCYECSNDVDKRITPEDVNRSCACLPGYFHDDIKKRCIKCEFPCAKCTSLT